MNLSDVTALGTVALAWAGDFVPRLLTAIIILIVGYYGAGWAARGVRSLMTRASHADMTMVPVVSATMRYGIMIVVFVAALGQLGVQTTSVLAVLGAAGLAIGLALQGTLANIAAGIMLLWLRPFRVGDYIENGTTAGTVEEINLFHTRLRTWDGIFKFVPNSQLWNTTLTNYSRNRTRLVLIQFAIAYQDDIATARKVLADCARAHPDVLADPPVQVVPLSFSDSSVVLQLRAWSTTARFWDTNWDLTEGGKKALAQAGISIPFPQQVVHWASEPRPPSPPASPSTPTPPPTPAPPDAAAR
jgi:small conductance mechanosensitive channel